MIYPVYVPQTYLTDTEVTIAEWYVEEGALVKEEDFICCLETTKTVIELEAGFEGYVIKRLHSENAKINPGARICLIADSLDEDAETYLQSRSTSEPSENPVDSTQNGVRATQGAERLAQAYSVDLDRLYNGKIIREKDVQRHIAASKPGKTGDASTAVAENRQTSTEDDLRKLASVISGAKNWKSNRIHQLLSKSPEARSFLTGYGLVYRALRDEFRETWNRGIPFNEMLIDRWEKAEYYNFEKDANIHESSFIFGDVTVGRNTYIGPYAYIDGSGGLRIGDNCSIAAGVQIYSHDTIKRALSGRKAKVEYAPTRIGDNCFIGPNTVVTKGVTIGACCMVGASSIVLSDIPRNSMAVGCPARVVARVVIEDDRVVFKPRSRKSEK